MTEATSFDDLWLPLGQRPGVSAELQPLVRALYDCLISEPRIAARIESVTSTLLAFLSTPSGRTDVNCTAVSHFLVFGDFELFDLPPPLTGVLADMAGTLHDTVSAPDIASNFESTPEQLLARLGRCP